MTGSATVEKKKILIVEDHPLFRAMLVQLIGQELGMEVCGETDNIKDAVALIKQTLPDAVIVDLTLRGSSGLELIKNLKVMNMRLPVLVLSMHAEALYAERVLRSGAKGYIKKRSRRLKSSPPSAKCWMDAFIRARVSPGHCKRRLAALEAAQGQPPSLSTTNDPADPLGP
jgi:DNA-binding NarL/FixJ family response regulator